MKPPRCGEKGNSENHLDDPGDRNNGIGSRQPRRHLSEERFRVGEVADSGADEDHAESQPGEYVQHAPRMPRDLRLVFASAF